MDIKHEVMEVHPPAFDLPGCNFGEYIHEVGLAHSYAAVHVQAFRPVRIFSFMLMALMRRGDTNYCLPPAARPESDCMQIY